MGLGGRGRGGWLLGGAVVGAFWGGLGVTLLVLMGRAVDVENGGNCSNDACPRGLGLGSAIAWPGVLVGLPVALAGLMVVMRSWRGAAALVVAAGLGVAPGAAIFDRAHGPTLGVTWEASGASGGAAVGSWVTGTDVVLVGSDRVTAYGLDGGRVRWAHRIADRQTVCAMSRAVEAGVGLLGYAGNHGGICSQIAAIDMAGGRLLWEASLVEAPVEERSAPDEGAAGMAISGDVVVVAARDGIAGLDLRSGTRRWWRAIDWSCDADGVVAGGGRLIVGVNCFNGPEVWALDPATGRSRWEISQAGQPILLAAAPPTVMVEEANRRDAGVVTSYTDDGIPSAGIVFDGRELSLEAGDYDALARLRARSPIVQGDRLIAVVGTREGTRIRVYDLADGRLLWSAEMPGVSAVYADPHRIFALSDDEGAPDLYTIENGTRKRLGVVPIPAIGPQARLYAQSGQYIVAPGQNAEGAPLAAFKLE